MGVGMAYVWFINELDRTTLIISKLIMFKFCLVFLCNRKVKNMQFLHALCILQRKSHNTCTRTYLLSVFLYENISFNLLNRKNAENTHRHRTKKKQKYKQIKNVENV